MKGRRGALFVNAGQQPFCCPVVSVWSVKFYERAWCLFHVLSVLFGHETRSVNVSCLHGSGIWSGSQLLVQWWLPLCCLAFAPLMKKYYSVLLFLVHFSSLLRASSGIISQS
ncbi:unnamed protein product [Ectocarpus fasciculatus]